MADIAYLLDTNICIYLLKHFSGPLVDRIGRQAAGTLAISSVTLAEISVGYGGSLSGSPELRAFLEEIPAIPFGPDAALIYGALPFKRRNFDRLIAAHTLVLGVPLVTNNEADFADVPGLRVENWIVA